MPALYRNKINSFVDNDLRRRDGILEALFNAIEESKIAVIIFSKGYASSRFCLEELAKIIECKASRDLIVIPIFYHVDPSDVRRQTGNFGEAFVRYEEQFEHNLEKVLIWRNALTQAANIYGFGSDIIRNESAVIGEVVKHILEILYYYPSPTPSDNKDPIIDELTEPLLPIESKADFSIIEISGVDDMGKTALDRSNDRKTLKDLTKVLLKWFLVVGSLSSEVLTAVFDQLSSPRKSLFALVAMLTSFLAVVFCLTEILSECEGKYAWKLEGRLYWLYKARDGKLFGTFWDILGLVCGTIQFILTAAAYGFYYSRHISSPINLSVSSVLFAFGMVASKVIDEKHGGDLKRC